MLTAESANAEQYGDHRMTTNIRLLCNANLGYCVISIWFSIYRDEGGDRNVFYATFPGYLIKKNRLVLCSQQQGHMRTFLRKYCPKKRTML